MRADLKIAVEIETFGSLVWAPRCRSIQPLPCARLGKTKFRVRILAGVVICWRLFVVHKVLTCGSISTCGAQRGVLAHDYMWFPSCEELFLAFSYSLLTEDGFGVSMVCMHNIKHCSIGVVEGSMERMTCFLNLVCKPRGFGYTSFGLQLLAVLR
jgi:hypothetical protein